MNRLRRIAVVILTAWMFVVALPASAHGSKGACRPGGFATGVLTSAMERYWRWDLAGEGAQDKGPLFLMPLPDGTPISDDPWITEGSESVTVGVGKSLVLPLTFFIGESYDDGSADDPADYPLDFKASSLLLTIDGRAIIDSMRHNLDCIYVPPTHFRKPIQYPVPTDYGAIAGEWMTGLGVLIPPLPPGRHIVSLQVVSPVANVFDVDVGYFNTWYVTVARH